VKSFDPKMPVVLCEVFPKFATKKRPAAAIRQINALYAAASKATPR